MNDSISNPLAGAATRHQAVADNYCASDDMRGLMNGLFSMLSHDLRTPLSAMSGWLYLLESDKLDVPGRKRVLAKIRTSLDEQVQLIDDVLLLSRCKTGHLKLDFAPFSPLVSLAAAIQYAAPSAVARKIDLRAPAPGQDALVYADPEYLRRVFELLLSHAVGSTPAGGSVKMAMSLGGGRVEISVTDAGAGYRSDSLPFVLHPFGRRQESSGRPDEGATRGLLLAAALVDALGGELRVASPGEGLGATLTVALPSPADSR